MVVEQYMYDAYRRNEERVNQLHRALDAGMVTEDFIRIIFDWPAPIRGEEAKPEPVTIPTKTIAPPPPKPMTSKKAEMMAKVKKLHLEGLNGAQIAKKTGLSEGTVSTYKKEMGLIPISSMTEISGPVPGVSK